MEAYLEKTIPKVGDKVMNAGKGYIIITDFKWYSFLKENYFKGYINFWRKDTRKIHVLNEDDRIYFLSKKTNEMKKRQVIGMAEFDCYYIKTIKDAWESYGQNNGYKSMECMLESLDKDNNEKLTGDTEIGCIILKEIIFFGRTINLNDTNIKFEKNIQSGKTLSLEEEENIIDLLYRPYYKNKIKDNEVAVGVTDEIEGEGRESERNVKVRINQYKFRNGLLRRYGKCLICGIDNKELLKASHSKPWNVSNAKEKIDLDNGLLLCANHDSLYDRYLISFDSDGKIIISKSLNEKNRRLLNLNEETIINVSGKCMKYIEWQRNYFYNREKES